MTFNNDNRIIFFWVSIMPTARGSFKAQTFSSWFYDYPSILGNFEKLVIMIIYTTPQLYNVCTLNNI